MIRYLKLVLFLFVLVSGEGYAKQLELSQIKAFSHLLLKETKDSPTNIFKHLSDKVQIETISGSSARGVTLSFDKTTYIDLINKSIEEIKHAQQYQETVAFDFKVLPLSKGEYTIRTYSKIKKRSIWSTFTLELIKNKIEIIKIVDFI